MFPWAHPNLRPERLRDWLGRFCRVHDDRVTVVTSGHTDHTTAVTIGRILQSSAVK